MSSSPSGPDPLDQLAEEFAARYRRGERPALAEYTDRHPELADQIRALFPALVAMEDLGSIGSSAVAPPAPGRDRLPERLGDYRLIRVAGKGGMGVVYEAVQESLGRHVALKVLPPHAAHDPMYLERFRREARSAAKLHHTNIVPVFGTGEADGVHFYAMQFIPGHGLDVVAAEVRRLRRAARPPAPAAVPAGAPASLARGLLSGRLDGSEFGPAAGPSTAAPAETAGGPGSMSGQTEGEYFRSVARIGAQAADAVDYAHRQGVLHRDIKPGNLLLDAAGTVWVTDFGLAKAEDAVDLTHTGDIVGTLRFMAPERFRGVSDRRTDVYGLGVTLYELLTLRPVFDDADRLRLIDRVRAEEPPRPRQVNPHIPRDLETVVRKAMAKEPGFRYPSAAALGDDLNRFLAGRPIKARHVGPAEQAWRWCRRNPWVAGLLATIFVVLAAGLTASITLWRRAEADSAAAKAQRDRADDAVVVAQDAVDGLLTEVGDEKLRNIREMDPVRRELLRKATAFYETLLEKSGRDPAVRRQAGRVYRKAGSIYGHLGRAADAEAAFNRAEALQADLAAEFPDDPAHRMDLAGTHLDYGAFRYRSDKSGEEVFARARGLLDELIADDPGEDRYRAALAKVLSNLAAVYSESWRFGPAEATYTAAVRLGEGLVAARPDDIGSRRDLAALWHNLGQLYRDTGRAPQADAAFRSAVAGQREVVRRAATAEERDRLAHFLANQGLYFYFSGRPGPAEPPLTEARALAERVVTEHPAVPAYKYPLGMADRGLGLTHQRAGRAAEAEAAYRRAAELLAGIVGPDANPDFRDELGWVYQNHGYLAQLGGRAAEADALYRKALAAWGPAVGGPDVIPRYLYGPGQVHHNLGMIAERRPGGWAAAVNHYQKALEYRERLSGLAPNNPAYADALAWTHTGLGNAYKAGERPADALRHYTRAVEAREAVARQPAVGGEYHAALAGSLFTLADYQFESGQRDEAFGSFNRGLAARESAARAEPDNLTLAASVGGGHSYVGVQLAKAGRTDEAVERFDRAVGILDGVLRRDGKHPDGRFFLATACGERGRAWGRAGRHADAMAEFDRAVELAAPSQRTWLRLARAAAVARAGDPVRAVAEVDAVAGEGIKIAANLVAAARAYALAAGVPTGDPLASASYRRRAVEFLRAAVAAGHPVDRLAADEDLAALRGDEEFRALARGVEQ